jgi:hypothetical protein
MESKLSSTFIFSSIQSLGENFPEPFKLIEDMILNLEFRKNKFFYQLSLIYCQVVFVMEPNVSSVYPTTKEARMFANRCRD